MKIPEDEDYDYEMAHIKFVSWPVGTWPLQEYNFKTAAKSVGTILLLVLTWTILQTELCLGDIDADKTLDAIVIGACSLLGISKVATFRFRPAGLIANFVSAVNDYHELKDDERRAIMKRHAYMGRVAAANMLFFSCTGPAMLTMLPMVAGVSESNETSQVGYPMPSVATMELLRAPGYLYLVIFVVETLMLLAVAAGNLGSDALFFGIFFHLCGQVEVLKLDFSRFLDDEMHGKQRFNELVKRHRHLLALADHLNDTVAYILILQLLFSCVLICITGFQFIMSLEDKNIVMEVKTFTAMCILLTQTFGYSYVGEYSKNQFGSIGYLAYCSDWYNAPCILSRDIVFVIMGSQTPVQLKAGKFFVMNLESYMSILKTSISYLSVLRVMITG